MDFLYFLKEKRASLLIGTGAVTAFVWFLFMLYFKLFEIKPFGAESHWSMRGTLLLFAPFSFGLLRLVYYFGSEDSPLSGTDYEFVYELSRWLYVAFKNCMVIFWLVTLIVGAPRIKYYQMRVAEGTGFDNLSYYERRSIFNIFQSGTDIVNVTSDHNEDTTSINLMPMFLSDGSTTSSGSDSSDSNPKSKDSDGGSNGLAKLALMLLAVLAVLASLVFYLSIVALSMVYANFWLVAIPCIAIGMITLGFIDIEDGPRI